MVVVGLIDHRRCHIKDQVEVAFHCIWVRLKARKGRCRLALVMLLNPEISVELSLTGVDRYEKTGAGILMGVRRHGATAGTKS